jgi:hypothetical protein
MSEDAHVQHAISNTLPAEIEGIDDLVSLAKILAVFAQEKAHHGKRICAQDSQVDSRGISTV